MIEPILISQKFVQYTRRILMRIRSSLLSHPFRTLNVHEVLLMRYFIEQLDSLRTRPTNKKILKQQKQSKHQPVLNYCHLLFREQIGDPVDTLPGL